MTNTPAGAVRTGRQGAVAWITLNRPDSLNAINDDVRQQLPRALRAADEDTEVRAIVVAGAGPRAFCVGADIKAFGDPPSPAGYRQSRARGHWIAAFDEARKPLIAAIHGYCLGGGLEIALACDIRIAADDATFALPEVSRGTMPGAGGTQRLARVIGLGRALDMLLSAESIDAAEAHRIGLVSRLVSPEGLRAAAQKLAERIAAHAPIAVAFAKEAMRKGTGPDFEAGMKLETDLLAILLTTEDRKEAGAAFREKRAPVFKGK
ncbi:MAG: enoyl-CoA hydratase/isomerase family protein [Betaproteobacteria bacterium]|nr:enoyl-CoA hydratase/isomerase family protein [Betaproteobacteria bacterium]